MSPPLFPLGFQVEVNRYFGLERPDGDRRGHPNDIRPRRIEGLRMIPEVDEDWDSDADEPIRRVTYPKGWEYLLVTLTGRTDDWYPEAELLAAGYAPPKPTATPQLAVA